MARNLQRLNRCDGLANEAPALLGIERRICCKQGKARAEKRVSAARRRGLAVHCGVGIEHLEVVDGRALEVMLLDNRIALRRAVENLAETELYLAGEERDHAAVMMGDDLQLRQFVENSGIDQARHAGGGLVRPAEGEPDFILRLLLGFVIGEVGASHRMDPDGQIVFDHAAEDRAKFRSAQRLVRDVGENLHAARAQSTDSTVGFRNGRIHIVHR